jgi:hypothetical protein
MKIKFEGTEPRNTKEGIPQFVIIIWLVFLCVWYCGRFYGCDLKKVVL